MTDRECVAFLQWALPRLRLRWAGFRRVRRQVCRRIAHRVAALGLSDPAGYRARLEADPAEWELLDSFCWISVSRFYRDRGVFEQLGSAVLPRLARAALARGDETLRVWSAGCASGEEPYSLSLAWQLAVQADFPGLRLHVLATDAHAGLLARAARAVYRASSLRELPASWRERAFEPVADGYRLRDGFRAGVELRREDLRRGMPDGPFDLVLCRNLAFTYFDEGLQCDVLTGLVARLVPGGALLVGSHESLPAVADLVPVEDTPGLHSRSP
jgi:chemotaxis protein methyltransferase CheR